MYTFRLGHNINEVLYDDLYEDDFYHDMEPPYYHNKMTKDIRHPDDGIMTLEEHHLMKRGGPRKGRRTHDRRYREGLRELADLA